MFSKLFRWLFYVIPLLAGFIWWITKWIFTKENTLIVWNWFISWELHPFFNIIIHWFEIFWYFAFIEFLIFIIRLNHDKKIAKDLIYLKVRLTRDDWKNDNEKRSDKDFKEKIAVMQQLYRALFEIWEMNIENKLYTSIRQDDFISFEMLLENKEVHFYVVTRKKYASIIEKQIAAIYPNANFFPEKKAYKFRKKRNKIWWYYFNNPKPFWFPVKTYTWFEKDPLNELANSFSKLKESESAVYQVIVHVHPSLFP